MKKSLLFLLSLALLISCRGQQLSAEQPSPETKNPKLVIGITVDQMRYDYLIRYWPDFGDDGFKRLVNDGFIFRNHNFSYSPTYTGPGHASIYTGTTPAIHGIIANDWWERSSAKMVYCASDHSVSGLGSQSNAGMMSPRRLRSSTISDELKLFTSDRSKVVGVSMKDRGAILPAGHQPNGAYWFQGEEEGIFMSSTYYGNELPAWVKAFNSQNLPESYLRKGWELLAPKEVYDESTSDNTPFESSFRGLLKPSFPYDLQALREANRNYDLIKATPHGNSLALDFAMAAIEGEEMGKDGITDLLALSFSSTDYVGHQFGPHSIEAQDTYLRLDREIARMLQYLDEKIGVGEYLIFVSADHGGAPVPNLVKSRGWPNDYFSSAPLIADLDSLHLSKYGEKLIVNYSNEQIFLDNDRALKLGLSLDQLETEIAQRAISYVGVVGAYTSSQLISGCFGDSPVRRIKEGYRPNMSGNVCLLLEPGWMEYGPTGTTHGTPYSYDTHVPFILYGKSVPKGESYQPSYIKDIAPTVCALLGIPYPSGCTGQPLLEWMDQ